MYSIQLRHLFGLLVSGGTKSGKTTFVKKLLTYVDIMIDKPSENITYYYSEFQNTFGEIQTLVPQIKFVQGLPDDILDTINPETRNLFIVDDMMGEKDAVIAKLFTKKSHHGNLSVIYIVQNLFHHSKEHRTISLNASYLCLTKNVRDVRKPGRDFRLRTSDFGLQTSDFGLQTSDFRLRTSDFGVQHFCSFLQHGGRGMCH